MEEYILPLSAACIFLALIIIQVIMKSKHPFRSALLSLLPGPAALLCVDMLQGFTSVCIPISPLSLSAAAVLGIPGVTALLIIQRIL